MGEEKKKEALENLREKMDDTVRKLFDSYQVSANREREDKKELMEMIRLAIQSKPVTDWKTMEGETFKTKVVEGNRVTIPEADRELLGVEPGDLVQVSVRVLKKAKDEE